MSHRDDLWATLLDDLHRRSWAHDYREGRLVLHLPERPQGAVEVLITPEEWSDMVGVAFGDVHAALIAFGYAVEHLPAAEARLYYESYAVVRGVDREPTSFSKPRSSGEGVKRVRAFPPSLDDT